MHDRSHHELRDGQILEKLLMALSHGWRAVPARSAVAGSWVVAALSLGLTVACRGPSPSPAPALHTPQSYDPPREIYAPTRDDLPQDAVILVPGVLPCPCVIAWAAEDTGHCREVDNGLDRSFSISKNPRLLLLADNPSVFRSPPCSRPPWDTAPTRRPTPTPTATPTELQIQLDRVHRINVPLSQRLATRKLVTKVDLIFASMEDYAQAADRDAILRKDSDRYDDAIVDAIGTVPDEVIDYVKEVYGAVLDSLRATSSAKIDRAATMRSAMRTLGSHR